MTPSSTTPAAGASVAWSTARPTAAQRPTLPATLSGTRTATNRICRLGARVPGLGIKHRADHVPVTDSNTLSDTSTYNLPSDDIYVIPARGANARPVHSRLALTAAKRGRAAAYGLGNYSSTGYGGQGTAALGGTDVYGYGVASISVAQPGTGYSVAPTVVLVGGGGSGASFTATVSGGSITGFVQVSAGSGYLTRPP